MIKSKLFSQFPELVYGMSEKQDGKMSYGRVNDKNAKKNRKNFFKKFKLTLSDLVLADQVHSNIVKVAGKKHLGFAVNNLSPFKKCDGLITKDSNVYLAIFTADCLPIFMYDSKKEICGLIHSGWKGTLKQIAVKAVGVFRKLGSDPKDILVYIGPSIGPCHYEVSAERAGKFKNKFSFWKKFMREKEGRIYLDLWMLNKILLLKSGLKEPHIEISRLCTFCNRHFASWRREINKNFSGNMMAFIGMRKRRKNILLLINKFR